MLENNNNVSGTNSSTVRQNEPCAYEVFVVTFVFICSLFVVFQVKWKHCSEKKEKWCNNAYVAFGNMTSEATGGLK